MKNSIQVVKKVDYSTALDEFIAKTSSSIEAIDYDELEQVDAIRLQKNDDHKTAIYEIYRAFDSRFDDLRLTYHDVDKLCKEYVHVPYAHHFRAPHHMLVKPWSYGQAKLDAATLTEIAIDVIATNFIKHWPQNPIQPIVIPCHPSVPMTVKQLLINTIEEVRMALKYGSAWDRSSIHRAFDAEKYPGLEFFIQTSDYPIQFILPGKIELEVGESMQCRYENSSHKTYLCFALPGMGKTTAVKSLNEGGFHAIDLDSPATDYDKALFRTGEVRRAHTAYLNSLALGDMDFIMDYPDRVDFMQLDLSRIEVIFFMPYNVDFAIKNIMRRDGKEDAFTLKYTESGKAWYNDWQDLIRLLSDFPNVRSYYSDYYVLESINKYLLVEEA